MKEAKLYKKLEDNKVKCLTCAHQCVISAGETGICGVRENRDGMLVSLVYGKAVAVHVDPIEKKPLFHFYPGTRALSMATAGCNMHCKNCQNADISQIPREEHIIPGQEVEPESIIQMALRQRCKTIAYTYTEPAVYWDYAYDTAGLAHKHGIKNIFVTNGYLSKDSMEEISQFLDGANVDLKSFRDKTYKSVCGARLKPVLDTIQRMKKLSIWVEVTTLVIPGLNDSESELKDIAQFLCDCDDGIPWHISRFHPAYRMMDTPPTPVETIQKARSIGLEAGLRFVYTGNIPGDEGESTFCYNCNASLIRRWGFQVTNNRLVDSKCPECGKRINGIW